MTLTWDLSIGKVKIDEGKKKMEMKDFITWDDFSERFSHLIPIILSKDSKKFMRSAIDDLGKTQKTKSDTVIQECIEFFGRVQEEDGKVPSYTEASYEPGEAVYEPGESSASRESGRGAAGIELSEKSKFKIYVEETVNLVLEHDGTLVKTEIDGIFKVMNNGDEDRIWDIDVTLEDIENTDIKADKKQIHIVELEAGEDWDMKYKIDAEKVKEIPLEISRPACNDSRTYEIFRD